MKSNVAVDSRDDYLLLFFVLKKMCYNVLLQIIKKRVTQPHGQATQVNAINCANDVTAAAVTDDKQPILNI